MDKIFEKLDMGNVSDGYHTFNELYRYRMLYNAAFFNELAKGDVKVCKSHKHYDGEECFGGGWFIVMAELTTGQISNHYENRYWGYSISLNLKRHGRGMVIRLMRPLIE